MSTSGNLKHIRQLLNRKYKPTRTTLNNVIETEGPCEQALINIPN